MQIYVAKTISMNWTGLKIVQMQVGKLGRHVCVTLAVSVLGKPRPYLWESSKCKRLLAVMKILGYSLFLSRYSFSQTRRIEKPSLNSNDLPAPRKRLFRVSSTHTHIPYSQLDS